jgi:glycosyltransferase involved in cell wall biosynthesis
MSKMEERFKRALAKKPSSKNQLSAEQLRAQKQQRFKTPKVDSKELNQKMEAQAVRIGGRNKIIKRSISPTYSLNPPSKYSIFVTGSIVSISGYDNLVYEIIKGLHSLGVDIRINASCPISSDYVPKHFIDLVNVKTFTDNEIIIMPPPLLYRWGVTKNSIILTMWESDRLEPFWVHELNKAKSIVVPSQWAIDTFKACGVVVPMYKIPLGYDPLIFYPEPIYPSVCTFGTAAALTAGGIRKNTKKVLEIFLDAFKNIDDVRLKIKLSPICPFPDCKDPRVEIVRKFLPPLELREWHNSLTAFINTSFAEGFGLHLLETMACGRPLISTKYSAVSEYFDETVGYCLSHKLIKASGDQYSGLWAEPNYEELAANMLKVYKNQEEAKILGEKAANRAKKFLWKDTWQALFKLLKNDGII